MDAIASIVISALLGFIGGLGVCANWRMIPRPRHEIALREIEAQRRVIDRLLSRHSERVADVERLRREFGKLAGQRPADKTR